jgi:hypothetical protein
MNAHDYEPIPGLPGVLPKGETILWQGSPRWQTFARQAMRVRWVIGYFVFLALWGISGRLSSGMSGYETLLSTLRLGGLAAVAVALLVLFAWLVARTTIYTITTRRVVMRFGIALPITIQISFNMIESAGAQIGADGAGDIALTLMPGQRIKYLIIWPHARPWKLAKAQPTLRGISDAAAVGQVLGRALAASASQPAKSITINAAEPKGSVADATGAGAAVPAAA